MGTHPTQARRCAAAWVWGATTLAARCIITSKPTTLATSFERMQRPYGAIASLIMHTEAVLRAFKAHIRDVGANAAWASMSLAGL